MQEHDVDVGGRRLHVREAGTPDGYPVFYLHGTPAAGIFLHEWTDDADRRGVRLIAYDRPGYGLSQPQPDRCVADAAVDVAAIATHLGLARFAVWGLSGGGPHALACARFLAPRVVAVASLGGPAPFGAEGLDWMAGMGEDNVEEFSAANDGREPLRAWLDETQSAIRTITGDALLEAFRTLLGGPDREVLRGELAENIAEATRLGLSSGFEGWIDDDLAFVKPWQFEVDEVIAPVLIVQGVEDAFVPVSHGKWLAHNIPTAEARLWEGEGHLSLLVRRIGEVHEWLLSHA